MTGRQSCCRALLLVTALAALIGLEEVLRPKPAPIVWTDKPRNPLQRVGMVSSEPWIVFLRIQKTGSKAFEQVIRYAVAVVAGSSQGCELEFPFCVTDPPASCSYADCRSVLPFVQSFADPWPECHYVASVHSDFDDMVDGLGAPAVRKTNTSARTPQYVTFIRNPVDRVISEFKAVRSKSCAWDYSPFVLADSDELVCLESYVENPYNQRGARNRQTRMIAGRKAVEEASKMEAGGDEYLLRVAQKRLVDSFAFVGVTDEFELSVRVFLSLLGIDVGDDGVTGAVAAVLERARRDGTDGRGLAVEPTPELVSRIQELNSLDMRLYKAAQELLSFQAAAQFSSNALEW